MTALAIALVGLAAVLVLAAFYLLPGVADRLVAADALAACAVAACLLAAAQTGHTAFIDVAVGFALVAFLGTVGWAHALARKPARGEEA